MNFCKAAVVFAFIAASACGDTNQIEARFRGIEESLSHTDAKLTRQLNELLWIERLSDVARVDHMRFTGPPPIGTNGLPAAQGSNEVVVSAMTFIPKKHQRQMPLIVFVHGEVHGNVVTDEDVHVVGELIGQGYAVIAPDYRGSSGYGPDYSKLIDYGGLEIEDVEAAREFAIEKYPEVDAKRVAIVGWSHGGLIGLMTVFEHPEHYRACFAGMPVSDLEERVRIRGGDFEKLLAIVAPDGRTQSEEYRRRSPSANAHKLSTPLLIHANTNDEDVTWREVRKLIDALKASDKDFSYTVYTNAPGGHLFNRLDTKAAHESREEILRFLRKFLR